MGLRDEEAELLPWQDAAEDIDSTGCSSATGRASFNSREAALGEADDLRTQQAKSRDGIDALLLSLLKWGG